jgi:hypothetical protein
LSRTRVVKRLSDVVLIKQFRNGFVLDVLSYLNHDVFFIDSTFSPAIRCLHGQNVSPKRFGSIGVVSDFCVRMQAKYTWRSEERNFVNEFNGLFDVFFFWDGVLPSFSIFKS